MNRKISRSQMPGINLTKNLQALISIRISLETVPINVKLIFDSKNIVSKSNCNNSSGNSNDNADSEQKYGCNNDNDNDDKNNRNNKNFWRIIIMIKVMIKIEFYSLKFCKISFL